MTPPPPHTHKDGEDIRTSVLSGGWTDPVALISIDGQNDVIDVNYSEAHCNDRNVPAAAVSMRSGMVEVLPQTPISHVHVHCARHSFTGEAGANEARLKPRPLSAERTLSGDFNQTVAFYSK